MRVGLAAAVPGRCHPHQPGVHPVLHVADKATVLDQHVALGRRPFVVDGQRTPMVGQRTVVDDRHPRGGDHLPHHTGVERRLFAVEVALQPVTNGLVQQHARPAGAADNSHLTCGRFDSLQVDLGLTDCLRHSLFPSQLADVRVQRRAPSERKATRLALVAVLQHHRHPHRRHGP